MYESHIHVHKKSAVTILQLQYKTILPYLLKTSCGYFILAKLSQSHRHGLLTERLGPLNLENGQLTLPMSRYSVWDSVHDGFL